MRVLAIPLEAVASVCNPYDLSFSKIRLIRKVLPVPPGASKNIKPYY